jgi:methyl-accepting chemotaxis protein
MKSGWVGWTDPLTGEDTENVPLVNFCLPITDKNGERVGVMAVDVSVNQLSKIILAAKPSENGYSVLVARNGQFIVHPDIAKLSNYTVFTHAEEGDDAGALEAAEAMLAGNVGEKNFKLYGKQWSLFFKPFVRSEWKGRYNGEGTLGWSVGVVYPDEDIFGMHNILVYLVSIVTILSLGVFFLLCTWLIRRKLKPLRMLNDMAQSVAAGNLDQIIAVTDRDDEIGQLQNRFGKMQQSLQKQVTAIKNETELLNQRSEMLKTTYGKTEEADKIKSSFLRYMVNQLEVPTLSIDSGVTTLCNNYNNSTKEEVDKQVNNIKIKSEVIVDLLNHVSHFTETDERKEAVNV